MDTLALLYASAVPAAYLIVHTAPTRQQIQREALGETSPVVSELVPLVMALFWLPASFIWLIILVWDALM